MRAMTATLTLTVGVGPPPGKLFAVTVPARNRRLGGVLSPQGRDREPVRRPQTQPPWCAPRLLPGIRDPPLHPARRLHPRRPEHLESARLGDPARGSRFLGAVPRRTGTRTPTPTTAAAQHPLRHAPRNISGCHGTGQIATPPRQRNPRIPVVDLDHPPKMTHYRARVRQICCSHSSNVVHTDRRSGRRSVECAEIRGPNRIPGLIGEPNTAYWVNTSGRRGRESNPRIQLGKLMFCH